MQIDAWIYGSMAWLHWSCCLHPDVRLIAWHPLIHIALVSYTSWYLPWKFAWVEEACEAGALMLAAKAFQCALQWSCPSHTPFALHHHNTSTVATLYVTYANNRRWTTASQNATGFVYNIWRSKVANPAVQSSLWLLYHHTMKHFASSGQYCHVLFTINSKTLCCRLNVRVARKLVATAEKTMSGLA